MQLSVSGFEMSPLFAKIAIGYVFHFSNLRDADHWKHCFTSASVSTNMLFWWKDMVARLSFVLTFSLIESKFLFHWQALKFWFCSHTTCNMHDANYLVLNLHVYCLQIITGMWNFLSRLSSDLVVLMLLYSVLAR